MFTLQFIKPFPVYMFLVDIFWLILPGWWWMGGGFKRRFNEFLILWRIDDLKLRIKIIKIRQVNWTEHLFCSVKIINFTIVVIFHNKKTINFSLLTAATFLLQHIFRNSHQRCSVKKLFLEISQNSYENTCGIAFF